MGDQSLELVDLFDYLARSLSFADIQSSPS